MGKDAVLAEIARVTRTSALSFTNFVAPYRLILGTC